GWCLRSSCWSRSTWARRRCGSGTAGPGTRGCCCTGIRAPTPPGTRARRGYGRSSKPLATEDHVTYSKRAMAEDCLRLMRELGYERFAVVGHDRGGYVAFPLAMDHPRAGRRLLIVD